MSKKNVIASVKTDKIEKINLSKFAKELENVNVSHALRERETIYIYPEEIKKEDINNAIGKKFRSSLRSRLKRFSNNIFVFAKKNEEKELIAEIGLFDEFYKKNYRINDYSLKSVSSSNDLAKNRDLSLMLQIIAECKSI